MQTASKVERVRCNGVKEWLARMGIGTFTLPWRVLRRLSKRSLPAKDHYWIMMLFRLFFRSYNVWISYPNPLIHEQMLQLRVNLCENNQQWFFRLRQQYDREEILLLAEGMRHAEMFIDIGSNIGIYALTIAQAFPDKRVVAFEPLLGNYESLRANIARNRAGNCVVQQRAISTAGRSVRFYINPIHDGGGSLIPPKKYKTGDVEIDVDEYRQKHPSFDPWIEVETAPLNEAVLGKSIVKIDVEGAELDVLRSGYDVLKRGLVELMIVEVMQDTVDDVVELMDEVGFDSFLMPEYAHISKGVRLPWFVRNIVCVRKNSGLEASIWQRRKESAG